LQAAGITPVLAHPERNAEVQQRPELLEPIVAGGTLVQLTAASVDGRTGRRAQACASRLLDRNLAHLLASDAHAPSVRAIGMSAAAATLGDEALAQWLTVEVPGAIVENQPLPPRPRAVRQRRRFLRR
jgi:protein-tyrosine phosphatase